MQELEINALYKILKETKEKYDKLCKWIKNKFGITKEKIEGDNKNK